MLQASFSQRVKQHFPFSMSGTKYASAGSCNSNIVAAKGKHTFVTKIKHKATS